MHMCLLLVPEVYNTLLYIKFLKLEKKKCLYLCIYEIEEAL
jgi:hypothetical protein